QQPKAEKQTTPLSPRRRLRLSTGILLLFSGIFTCFAVVSYFFTWQRDQDKLISRNGLTDFLFSDSIGSVQHCGGRMGAALARILVYEGVGVAALAIGIWLSYLGSLLIYGRKKIPSMRYMRWLAVLLLIAAPVLAYLAPTASFPYGGALGNEAVAY